MKTADLLTGLLFSFLSLFLYLTSLRFPAGTAGVPGPAAFPKFVSTVMGGLAFVLLLETIFSRERWERIAVSRNALRIMPALLFTAGFLLLWVKVRFEIGACLYLLAMTAYYGKTAWPRQIVFSLVTTACVVVVFGLVLRVPLVIGR